ncbi:DNA cytosine methyltransferase [Chitinophaga sp. YR627]|uniref:DNA cytosine methyltransferase n=1 Tax=Chitinophaga sp. YR627 TaxID=1881041 RepID=UPI001C42FF8B
MIHKNGDRPRILTARECLRLIGFDAPGGNVFKIPSSNAQARQFGNSVVVSSTR